MVSNCEYMPIFESSKIIKINEISKDKLASALQQAVTQVQNSVTLSNTSDPLRTDLPEVWHLCDCLDKTFLHGLRQLEIGYWPFVKEFMHQDVQLQIQTLNYVRTSLGRGRAWLCMSLKEASLEGYVNSFIQNPKLVEKHYLQPALLRDVQRMQLILTLMAGLENIQFELLADSSFLDMQGFVYIGGVVEKDSDADTFSFGSCSATVTPVSTKSILDGDSGVLSIESATEASMETGKRTHGDGKCPCSDCSNLASLQLDQRERVSRLIHLEPALTSDDSGEVSLEVVHTKITKRRKKKSTRDDLLQRCAEDNPNLPSSECESSDIDSSGDYTEIKTTDDPSSNRASYGDNSSSMSDLVDLLGEREAPEGQEDPPSSSLFKDSDNCSTPKASEEFSIYDNVEHSEKSDSQCTFDEVEENDERQRPPSLPECDKVSCISYEDDVAKGNVANAAEDLSLKVDVNAVLYLMLEVFLNEGEELYKIFLTSMYYNDGSARDVFLLLSNVCLYVLQPGDSSDKFKRHAHFLYEELDCITVDLNYQGFFLFGYKQENHYHICTGSENLTRNILSSLEVVIRRSGVTCLPAVSTDASSAIATWQKKVAQELCIKEDTVILHHFVLVSWENYMGSSPLSTPTGPLKEGFLMYRHMSREKSKWNPGFFILKGGFLYSFGDSCSKEPLFYFQLSAPRFRGCQRSYTVERPHAFELLLHGGNESLTLAAANDLEASQWLQAILQTVTIAGQIRDLEPSRMVTPCSLLVANSCFFTLLENQKSHLFGRALLNDLVALRVDNEFPTCCVLEFESGEANSCSGEWILLFADEEEKVKFGTIVATLWENLFQVPLTVAAIKDLSLWGRCRECFQKQENTKEALMTLCLDS